MDFQQPQALATRQGEACLVAKHFWCRPLGRARLALGRQPRAPPHPTQAKVSHLPSFQAIYCISEIRVSFTALVDGDATPLGGTAAAMHCADVVL